MTNRQRGHFITLEGGEGTGKSTQIRLMEESLRKKGVDVLLTREPGGSPAAEEIRNILLSGSVEKWDSVSEVLLFSAARRNHLTEVIWPALKQGTWVISDRFADSTMAYQGYGRADNLLKKEDIQSLYRLIAGDFEPDLTILLDIEPEKGLLRVKSRGDENRLDKMDLSFHHNLRNAFLDIARENPNRFCVVDASQSIEFVHKEIMTCVEESFK